MTTRVKLRLIGVAVSLIYTVIRVIIVQATLVGYGINPWIFMIIDAVTGILYVLGIEQLIMTMNKKYKMSWSKILLWSAVTIASFALPYLYLFIASRELPFSFGAGLGIVVALLLVNAGLSFKRRVQQERR